MKLAEILGSLFPHGHDVQVTDGLLEGTGSLGVRGPVCVLGVTEGQSLGVEEALGLARRVLDLIETDGQTPLLMLVDAGSQRMSQRDELLGLNEYLAHLAKALWLAERRGHRTIGLLYGGAAAGAFIATALATGSLAALPDARPSVMDLPSMARVTKVPLAVLQEKAKATPVFAPGLENLRRAGAVQVVWDPDRSLAAQLEALLASPPDDDTRGALGLERGGRLEAAPIANRVEREARHG